MNFLITTVDCAPTSDLFFTLENSSFLKGTYNVFYMGLSPGKYLSVGFTIGDGYLAIAGAPDICEDHSERLTAVALEMITPFTLPDEINEYIIPQKYLSFRIGMNVGSIVGGVLGNSRPMSYDIWGDAVNIASRMQSSGEPDKIHVTADFVMHLKNRFALCKEQRNIRFEKRGNIEIKHMGKIFTYYISTIDLKEKNEELKPLPNLKTA